MFKITKQFRTLSEVEQYLKLCNIDVEVTKVDVDTDDRMAKSDVTITITARGFNDTADVEDLLNGST